ncbi:MAG TPA: tetratricopeptide repeat protein [bacterium]|nr:tetratricopeptide repeat protein [bacterium]
MDDEAKAKYDQSLYRAADHNQPIKESNDRVVARAQYNRGVNALKSSEITQAIEFFRSATELDDEKAEYWAKLAFALAKHKNPRIQREAIDHCNKAISMQNENANYHALMGFIYQQLDAPDEARVHYKRALSWDPHHQRSRQELQKIAMQQNEEKRKKSLGYKILKILKPPQKDKQPSRQPPLRRKK